MAGWENGLAGGDDNLRPEGLGWKAWSIDPHLAAFAATQANTHLVAVWLKAGTVITGVDVPVTAAGVAVTFAKVGLYDQNLNLLASSADNLAGFQAAGWVRTPFAAPFVVPASGLYYLASGFVATTTLPSVLNVQQTSALSINLPGAVKAPGVHAQVPVAGQGLPNPAASQGAFTNVPLLCAY